MKIKKHEFLVCIFVIITLYSIFFIYFKVAHAYFMSYNDTYQITASFNNIGGLKIHSPVKLGGVVIGRVTNITIDPKSYTPKVLINIENKYNRIPDTSSLEICTAGLLGEQYLALNIGFMDSHMNTTFLSNNSTIYNTQSAIVLEDLISLFLYNTNKNIH